MLTIVRMRNRIQNYAWGSRSAIARLVGSEVPSDEPQAELWMGTHPKGPSDVEIEGRWLSLHEWIATSAPQVLGEPVDRKFEGQLPFLFKVLAAAEPLSIQAHPNRDLAQQGFEAENRAGIPLDHPRRNFRDPNHKPECICALSQFWALNGFRPHADMASKLKKICPEGLRDEIAALQKDPCSRSLEKTVRTLLTAGADKRQALLQEAVGNARLLSNADPAFDWIVRLHEYYPDDTGVLSPVLLNLVRLEPGQALFLTSGRMHAYLDGTGIELMANSDNVLRGGLTPKHIDVDQLIQVVDFSPTEVEILFPKPVSPAEYRYDTPADEFVLSVLNPVKGVSYVSPDHRSVEIVFCTEGEGEICDAAGRKRAGFQKGDSFLIPAEANAYRIDGNAILYRASVPL